MDKMPKWADVILTPLISLVLAMGIFLDMIAQGQPYTADHLRLDLDGRVLAVGEESADTFTGRTSVHAARLLGQEAVVFPSHHGGFMGPEHGYAGQPEAFAEKLRHVLDG